MADAAPQSVLTKYAVVRAPRPIPLESVHWNLVQRPEEQTALWRVLSDLLDAGAPSSSFEKACSEYLKDSVLRDPNSKETQQFYILQSRSHALPSVNSGRLASLARDGYVPADADQRLKLQLILWDELIARLVPSGYDALAPSIVRTLAYMQMVDYALSLEKDLDASPVSLDPQVVMPERLTSFIVAARRDARRATEIAIQTSVDEAAARARIAISRLLTASALRKFLLDALKDTDFSTPNMKEVAPADSPPVEGETALGSAAMLPVLLSARRLSLLPTLLSEFVNEEFGIPNLSVIDIVSFFRRVELLTARLEAELLSNVSLPNARRASEIVSRSAVNINTNQAALPSLIE
jgi:hypothetical protein